MSTIHRLTTLLLICLTSLGEAQTVIEYWHSQDAAQSTVQSLAEAFNASQSEYVVVPRYVGNYQEGTIKLIAALGGDNAPVLFSAEGTLLPRLVEEGALAELSDLAAGLPEGLIGDLYPSLWASGELQGGRYGLPWTLSLPVLFYNATAFDQLGVAVPTTWAEFEEAAARLTTRQTEGYIHVSTAFIFEMMVSTRGGSVVTEKGQPNFDSQEALDALSTLKRIADAGNATIRSFAELDVALVDFVRTKGMMAFASIAFWPEGQRYSVAFKPAVATSTDGDERLRTADRRAASGPRKCYRGGAAGRSGVLAVFDGAGKPGDLGEGLILSTHQTGRAPAAGSLVSGRS